MPNGDLDASFDPGEGADFWVYAVALQPDGKILIGGGFTTVDGVRHNGLARLDSDGSLDANFRPTVEGAVFAVLLDSSNRILVGGDWWEVNGDSSFNGITRLTTSGVLDRTFSAGAGTDLAVNTIAFDRDGNILLGGSFTEFDGTTRNGAARLDKGGLLDLSFDPGDAIRPSWDTTVNAIVVLPSGHLLVGGAFDALGSPACTNIARLNPDGTRDASFAAATSSTVLALGVQAASGPLIAGAFRSVNSTLRPGIARLDANGSLDATFDAGTGTDNIVRTLVIQPDGRVLIVGDFTSVDGTSRNRIARLLCSTNVVTPPTIIQQPIGQTVMIGDTVSFAVLAEGTEPLSYQWLLNGEAINGATKATLAILSAQEANAGNYSVTISNAAGFVLSSNATLVVNVPPPVAPTIYVQPISQSVTAGQSVSFSVMADGTPPLLYQWLFNGLVIDGATNAVYPISGTRTNDSGSYSVVVSNTVGDATSTPAILTVVAPFALSLPNADQEGNLHIAVPADARFYYVLYDGHLVTEINHPVDIKLGIADSLELICPPPPSGVGNTFYRVLRVPRSQPQDTDGDGIDDVFELTSLAGLNPLDAQDALLDADGDLFSNVEEYVRGFNLRLPDQVDEELTLQVVPARTITSAPGSVTLQAHLPGSVVQLKSVDFYSGSRRLGQRTSAPFEWTEAELPEGEHHFRARAVFSGSVVLDSDWVNVAISGPAGGPGTGEAVVQRTLAVGYSHQLAIAADATLWGWGDNDSGQLGLGHAGGGELVPVMISDSPSWRSVAAGDRCSLALRADGTIWEAGQSGTAPLSYGSTSLTMVGTENDWAAVLVQGFGRYGIKTDGSLWGWGLFGSPLLGPTTLLPTATQFGLPERCVAVSTTARSFLGPSYILTDGSVWGAASTASSTSLIQVLEAAGWQQVEWRGAPNWGYDVGVGLKSDGTLWWLAAMAMQAAVGVGTQIGSDDDWESIGAEFNGTFVAVKHDGTLWRWAGPGGTVADWLGPVADTPTDTGTASSWVGFQTLNVAGFGLMKDGTIWQLKRISASGECGGMLWPTDPLELREVPFNGHWALPWGTQRITTASSQSPGRGGTDATGNLPVQVSVDSVGAAAFSLPISVPPGTAGLQPGLAVTYNSRSANGLLGVGASLSGLSVITRTPRTIAQDDAVGGVNFDSMDRFALDGQRLVAVSGIYGANGTEYRTESESFTKVISYGQTGSGPAFFKVWTKSGQIMEFGNTADSRIEAQGAPHAIIWGVNKIEDVKGNYLTVAYAENNVTGEYAPTSIAYTGNTTAGVSPYASLQLIYESRPDIIRGRIGPYPVRISQRLAAIQTLVGTTPVFRYTFAYDVSKATRRSRLRAVTLCDANGTCFPPTRFDDWQDLDPATLPFDIRANSGIPGYWNDANHYNWRSGDINGDGFTDLVHFDAKNHYNIWLSRGDGKFDVGGYTQAGVGGYSLQGNDFYSFIAGDFNGDGRTDFFHPKHSTTAELWLGTSQGSFTIVGNCAPANYGDEGILQNGNEGNLRYYPGDWNGDGLSDLIHIVDPGKVKVWLSQGDGQFKLVVHTGPGEPDYNFTRNDDNYFVFDLNGDGKSDIVHFKSAEQYWEWISIGNGHFTILPKTPQPGFNYDLRANDSDFRTGDFNGDGRTDFIHFYSPNVIHLWLSKGDGDFVVVSRTPSTIYSACQYQRPAGMADYNFKGEDDADYQFVITDLNGDGRTDLIHFFSNSEAFLWISEGDGTFRISRALPSGSTYGLKGDAKYEFIAGDFNGDGKSDLVHVVSRDKLHVWQTTGPLPDLLGRVTDGLGNSTQLSYQPLTVPSVYTADSGASYPTQDLRGPLYVVSSQRVSDGQGGVYDVRYKYSGAKADLVGRGFLGFRMVESSDTRSSLRTVSEFRQDHPFIGQVARSILQQMNGSPLKQTDNTWTSNRFSGSPPIYFPYVSQSITRSYELDRSLVTTTTTSNEYDNYGNATRVFVISGDGYTRTTTNRYANNETTWILGRLTNSTVTATAPSQPTLTRTSAFRYTTDGLLDYEEIEPGHATLRLRTDYDYDSFGHAIKATVSGTGITTRSASVVFDALGRFPLRTINARGHVERYQHDARFGGVTEVVGPNNLTNQWTFDGFGRKTREEHADGTSTQWVYSLPDDDAPANATYMLTTLVAGQGPATVYFDRVGRTVRSVTRGLNDELIFQDTEYDKKGRVHRSSRNYYKGDAIYWTEYRYDLLGRVVSERLPDGATTRTRYQGLTTIVTNALNQKFTQTLNSLGMLVQSLDHLGSSLTYAYDAFGNLVRTSDLSNNVIAVTYDLRGRKISMSDPDMGTWYYTNNVLGELVAQRDAKDQVVTMEYDLLGRLVRRVEPEGETRWLYDTAPKGIGKLARVTSPGGYARTNSFDALGRPSSTTTSIGDSDYTFSTTYDGFSRVRQATYPSGVSLQHTYNTHGFLTATTNLANNTLVWRLISLNAVGQTTREAFGNGVTTSSGYDPERGWVQTIQTGSGAAIQNLKYTFNQLGSLWKREDLRQGLAETFLYDALNRLTNAAIAGRTPKNYSYDRLGNLTSKSDVGGYTYGGAGRGPHAVATAGAETYFYDANGNQISGASRTITYASFNKPLQISRGTTSSTFAYDADHAPMTEIAVAEGVTRTNTFIGGLYEVVSSGAKREERHYLAGGGSVAAVFTREFNSGVLTTNRTRYLHGDHLGSVETITDQTGTVVERFSYDPHGKRRDAAWNDITSGSQTSQVTEHAFSGHLQLDSLDVIHMGGRAYDPLLGRMLSADPFIQNPSGLPFFDRYSYVLNNPLSLTDPSGYFSFNNITHFFRTYGRTVGAMAGGAAATWVTGGLGAPAILAGAAGGAVQGAIQSRGDARAIVFSAAVAGVAHGLAGEISGALQRGEVSQTESTAFSSFDESIYDDWEATAPAAPVAPPRPWRICGYGTCKTWEPNIARGLASTTSDLPYMVPAAIAAASMAAPAVYAYLWVNHPWMVGASVKAAGSAALAGGGGGVASEVVQTASEMLEGGSGSAAEGAAIAWGPLNGPGPLGESVANTFRGGSYAETVLGQETTLYRAYGGRAVELGSYWTRTPPAGPLQSTIDSALNPAWGNTAQNVATITVPSGTTIYEGFAAPQGGLLGGGSQVYIPKVNPNWLVHP